MPSSIRPRALATKPGIILADEPTGNLDSKTGLDVLSITPDILADIAEQPGLTDLGCVYMQETNLTLSDENLALIEQLVTHDSAELPAYADELISTIESDRSVSAHYYGVDDFTASLLEVRDGSIDHERFRSGDYVLVSPIALGENEDMCCYPIGSTVELTGADQRRGAGDSLDPDPHGLLPLHVCEQECGGAAGGY